MLFRLPKRSRGYTDKDRLADYHATFNSPAGRRVLADLASECSFWEDDAVTETNAAMIGKGSRALFRHILRWLEIRRIEDIQEE